MENLPDVELSARRADVGQQLSWVMVKTIGLVLAVYSFLPLVTAVGSGYTAYTLRHYKRIIISSSEPIPATEKDTPENRMFQKAQSQTQAQATVSLFLFLLSFASGIYCLKRGAAVQRLLLPPKEAD